MTKKRLKAVSPTEAEVAAPSMSGLMLDNLEDRVEALRRASGPTRPARNARNHASRAAMVAEKKAKGLLGKKEKK